MIQQKRFQSKLILGCLAVLAALTLLSVSANAVTFSLSPNDQIAGTGDVVSLDLIVSGLTNGGPDSLGAYDIDIGFDAAALSPGVVTFGGSLGDPLFGETLQLATPGVGLLNLAEISFLEADSFTCFFCVPPYLDDIQADTFVLASLQFNVLNLSPGTQTVVTTSVLKAGDGFGIQFAIVDTGNALIRNPGVNPPIPEPSTILLFGTGLAGLAAWRLRRQQVS